MRVALITAIFGGYDTLKPLPASHGFDVAVCLRDDESVRAEGWDYLGTPKSDNPRLAAKHPKMQPHKWVDADVWVWVDGQIQVKDGLRDFAVESLGDGYLAAFEHPERDCLYAEADVCAARGLAPKKVLDGQTEAYRAQGMPARFGLWECAVLAWSRHGMQVGSMWWREVTRHSLRDQIALPFLTWAHNVDIRTMPGRSRRNPYAAWTPHARRG